MELTKTKVFINEEVFKQGNYYKVSDLKTGESEILYLTDVSECNDDIVGVTFAREYRNEEDRGSTLIYLNSEEFESFFASNNLKIELMNPYENNGRLSQLEHENVSKFHKILDEKSYIEKIDRIIKTL